MKKIYKLLAILALILTIPITKVEAAGSITRASNAAIYPGDTFTININTGVSDKVYYEFNLKNSDSSVASGTTRYVSNSPESATKSITFTAKKVGTTRITVSDDNSLTYEKGSATNMSGNYIDIKVVEKPVTPPSNSGSGATNDTTVKTETPEERKAREEREAAAKAQAEKEAAEKELENKKKTPLVGEISILSESDRLKGKEVVKLETEFENFKYSAKLPRSVDAFKLDLKPIADDVTLTYDAMYKLDEGHDKVEITVKAVQGEIEQTFNLTVNRHVESKVTLTQEDKNYSLLVDDLIDGKMKELGVTRNLFNKEKDDTFYYYEYEGVKFALVYDADKVARWVIMDDKGAFVEEVILIIDQNKKPRFIVDVPLDEDIPTLNGNRYEQTNLTLPKEILALDESMNFNDQVSAWVYDETGFITHEYVPVENKDVATTEDSFVDVDQDSPYQLVYVGNDASVQTAFVAFDGVNNNMTTLVYVLSGLLVALALAFIIYWRTTSKKIKVLLTRR